jgi:hypothetical protein
MDQCDRSVAGLSRSKLERLGPATAPTKLRGSSTEPRAAIDTDPYPQRDTNANGYGNANSNSDDEPFPLPNADDSGSDVATEGSHEDGLPCQTEVRCAFA